MSAENAELRCLGVMCQHCGESIRVPEHLMSRQILVAEDDSDPASRYVSTLLNLRCKACRKEYFYDVTEICELEAQPRACSPRGHDGGPNFLRMYHARRHR
jgi:hypothetical protein